MTNQNKNVNNSSSWLVTGVAGFIGSNLLNELLSRGNKVIGIDNFSTGSKTNLNKVKKNVGSNWKNFFFAEHDINDIKKIDSLFKGVEIVVHLAALGSVPRSIKHPIASHDSNVTGFLNILNLSKDSEVQRFVFASSSSVYGDHESLPKLEDRIGNPLSPYAGTKLINEIYAEIFFKTYGFSSIGLRFFNVFGPMQNPKGEYAAVIPKWIDAILNQKDIIIYGDGEITRDFCYVANAIQAIFNASHSNFEGFQAFNIAYGDQKSLFEVAKYIISAFEKQGHKYHGAIKFNDFRDGDIMRSLASIEKAQNLISYNPKFSCENGLDELIKYTLKKY